MVKRCALAWCVAALAAGCVAGEPASVDELAEEPEPEAEIYREIRCAKFGSEECVQQCAAIRAWCVHRAHHPYSPSSGIGDLYWCKGGVPTWTCSYHYANGDNCTKISPTGKWLCRYSFATAEEDVETE